MVTARVTLRDIQVVIHAIIEVAKDHVFTLNVPTVPTETMKRADSDPRVSEVDSSQADSKEILDPVTTMLTISSVEVISRDIVLAIITIWMTNRVVTSPVSRVVTSPVSRVVISPVSRVAISPVSRVATSPVSRVATSPVSRVAITTALMCWVIPNPITTKNASTIRRSSMTPMSRCV